MPRNRSTLTQDEPQTKDHHSTAPLFQPNAQTRAVISTARPPKVYDDRQTTPRMEARHLQRLIFHVSCKKETTPIALSALARAWVALNDSLRIMSGVPLPGQFRPEAPPSGKRAVIEMMKSQALSDAPRAAAPPQPADPGQPAAPDDSREADDTPDPDAV